MPHGEVTLIPKGEACDAEWKMNFASFLERGFSCYSSPEFSFEGESWFMEIWSNNCVPDTSSAYIYLRIYKQQSNGPPISMELSFSLKTLNGKKIFRRQISEVFKGYCHEDIDRFVSKSGFVKRQSELLSSGFLTLVCTLKRLNSSGSTIETFEHLRKKYEDAQLMLEKTLKEKDDIKNELDTYKSDHEILVKEKLDLEADLKATREKLDETNVLGLSGVHNRNKILQDLKQAFEKQENCDVILRVKEQEFQAHKFILAARSPVFASTFRNDMKEKETGIVDIEDCDPSIFPTFLCFLYTDDVDSLSKENIFGLFSTADKYDIPDLRKKCLEFMKENLSIESFCETLTVALQHTETEMIQFTTDFFVRNVEDILVTVKWQSFAAENPTQSNELFIKFVSSGRCLKS